MSDKTGVLYLVGTPIGNLSDLSERGRNVRISGLYCGGGHQSNIKTS